jgi:hypothetical protein
VKILGREPAVLIAFLSALLSSVAAFGLNLSPGVQGGVTAVVAAAFGVWTAFHVSQDKILPALLGFAQAGFSLLLAFGLNVPTATQAAVTSLVAVSVAMFVRTQVVAPVGAAPEGGRHEVVPLDAGTTPPSAGSTSTVPGSGV